MRHALARTWAVGLLLVGGALLNAVLLVNSAFLKAAGPAAPDEPARKEPPAARPASAAPAAPAHRAGARWEYRTVTRQELLDLGKNDVNAGLNKLGDDGWELVAVRPGAAAGPERGPRRPGESGTEYYFKRPASAPMVSASAPPAGPGEGQFVVFRLKFGSAVPLSRMLNELMNGEGGSRRMRVVADPETNQLLLKGTDNDLATVEALLNKLDTPPDNAKPTTAGERGEAEMRIFPLKHASAPALAQVLDELMNGAPRSRAPRVSVVPEPVTNRLLVKARPDDLETIAKLLTQLDIPAEKEAPPKPEAPRKNPKP
jgi:hypothetical protein